MKEFIAGLIIGSIGITSVFGASFIKSAEYKSYDISLNGEKISISEPFISVTDTNDSAKVYMPVREILEALGYTVSLYDKSNTINIVNDKSYYNIEQPPNNESNNVVIDLKNRNTFNMAESGNFYAKDNQTLKLQIDANVINGSVDFTLFNPDGEECDTIHITKMNETKTIELSKGRWAYNCTGMFRGGGECKIVGIIE